MYLDNLARSDTVVSISYAGGDTRVTTGIVGRKIENALIFDFGETYFWLDTLAYTAGERQLQLVTLPYGLRYKDLATIEMYFTLFFSK